MRAALFLLLLTFAAPASAAPTCEDRSGNAVRCENPAAMPLGWHAPQSDRHFPPADPELVFTAVAMVVLLFALIALMPEFEGWDGDDGD